MDEMKTHGFMPHNDGYPNLSRDWQDVDCSSRACVHNDLSYGKCLVPSRAKIGSEGRCEGFVPRGAMKVSKGEEHV